MRTRLLVLWIVFALLAMQEMSCGRSTNSALSPQNDLRGIFSGKIAVVVEDAACAASSLSPSCASDHIGNTSIYVLTNRGDYPLIQAEGPVRQWDDSWDCPRWSPKGDRIILVNWDYMQGMQRSFGFVGYLYLANADGSGLVELAETNSCASWAPDGERLIFFFRGKLYVMDITTNERNSLIDLPSHSFQYPGFSWSPDASRIIYTTQGATYEMNSDGTGVTRVLAPCEGCSWSNPRYSPDGKQIMLDRFLWNEQETTGRYDTYLLGRDGQLTWLGSGRALDWSPDGSQIAFPKDGAIWVMDADGSRPRMLLRSEEWIYGGLDWGP